MFFKILALITLLLATATLCILPHSAMAQTPNEGAGLLVSDVDGALPKALWAKQPRSEITYLLKNLPANAPFQSMQQIKRAMLLSNYDLSLIEEDKTLSSGEDLLTLRLLKLMQMGLNDDAFSLYTKAVQDPGTNDSLAQIGILLILEKKGLATACLEQKAYGQRFSHVFWKQLEAVCTQELDLVYDNAIFEESSVLTALYNEPSFKISANNIKQLESLSFLELAILKRKDAIDYTNLSLSDDMSPHITNLFLNDTKFPAGKRNELENIALFQGIKNTDNMKNKHVLLDDIHLLSQNDVLLQVISYLNANEIVPEPLIEKLTALSSEKPENNLYLQLLKEIGLGYNINMERPFPAININAFPPSVHKEVTILKTWLDNSAEFSNNPDKVYEKQISLTQGGATIASTVDWTKWLEDTSNHQFKGLSLLNVLSNNKNTGVRSNFVLSDIRKVGLVEQANQIAKDMLVGLMRKDARENIE